MSEKQNSESLDLVTIDRLDDELIMAELQGRAVSTWAYKFTQKGGHEVTGLSIAGVEEATRECGHRGEAIRIVRHEWRETDDSFYATVEAGRFAVAKDGREILLDTSIGAKREAKVKSGPNGWYNDPFAFEKSISKAARNAKAKLLDEAIKSEIVASALKAGRARDVPKTEQKTQQRRAAREEQPPPPEQVRAEEEQRKFYALAAEMRIKDQAPLHAKLRLKCAGEGNHDQDDPGACHALRDAVDMLAIDGRGHAGAWETVTRWLRHGSPLEGGIPRGFREGGIGEPRRYPTEPEPEPEATP